MADEDAMDDDFSEPVPFLSVVMRTQGRRPFCLEEALTGLSAQTCDDFEVLIVAHNVDESTLAEITALVEEFPDSFRTRLRVIPVTGGGRSMPLNEGFAAARGRYIAMLDDDDVPFAHWVETFAQLVEEYPGRVARANTAVQPTDLVEVSGRPAARADNGFSFPFPSEYILAEHLVDNRTPNMAVAIPREFFHVSGARFDDSLTTHEDWEFITRAASTYGVASSPKITALYRWWGAEESSRTVQSDADRARNIAEVHRRHDTHGVFFPGPEIPKLRAFMQELREARTAEKELLERLEQQQREFEYQEHVIREEWARGLQQMKQHYEREAAQTEKRIELLAQINDMVNSRRWRMTAPLRKISGFISGNPEIHLSDCFGMSTYGLLRVIETLTGSRSWTMGEGIRRILSLLRR